VVIGCKDKIGFSQAILLEEVWACLVGFPLLGEVFNVNYFPTEGWLLLFLMRCDALEVLARFILAGRSFRLFKL
jgi:hypothetical protein